MPYVKRVNASILIVLIVFPAASLAAGQLAMPAAQAWLQLTIGLLAFGPLMLSAWARKARIHKLTQLLLALGGLAWSAVWVARLVLAPDQLSPLQAYLSLLVNLLLCAGVCSLLLNFRKASKWPQIVLDMLMLFIIGVVSLLIFYFEQVRIPGVSENIAGIKAQIPDATERLAVFISGYLDFVILMVFSMLLISSRDARRSIFIRLMALAAGSYITADVLQAVARMLPGAHTAALILIDPLFALAFSAAACAGWRSAVNLVEPPSLSARRDDPAGLLDNRENLIKAGAVLGVSLVLLHMSGGTITRGMSRLIIINLLLPPVFALVYLLLSNIIQNLIKRDRLLRMHQEINTQLEVHVAERTRELQASNRRLERLSRYDPVTGLLNRQQFGREFEEKLRALKPEEYAAIFFIDLDRFKQVNDTYGHDAGDALLAAVADRFSQLGIPDLIAARLGGDEFALLFHGVFDLAAVEAAASRLINSCQEPVDVGGNRVYVGMSIGIAVYPDDNRDLRLLLKNADIAMYHAKELGRGQYVFFSRQHQEKILRRSRLELMLEQADYDQEFKVFFQPQFDTADGRLIGAEALLRWHQPQEGWISPGELIPIAEDTGLIVPLGAWVIRQAIRQAARWNGQGRPVVRLAVNLSSKQLESGRLLDELRELLTGQPVQPAWLDFEITESMALRAGGTTVATLEGLVRAGFSLSIDDFGTGYSSMNYLRQFSVNRIKIARELIEGIAVDRPSASIVHALVMMAGALDLSVIAEGVETEEQLAVLKSIECGQVQGYLTGRPVPAEEFERRWLPEIGADS